MEKLLNFFDLFNNDYVHQILMIITSVIYVGCIQLMKPLNLHRMQFFEQSPELSYRALNADQVPTVALILIVILIPLFFILLKVVIKINYVYYTERSFNVPYKLNPRMKLSLFLIIYF